jgi:hypothetical protein
MNSCKLILLLVLPLAVFSQKKEADTSYIQKFSEYIHLTAAAQTNNTEFIVGYPSAKTRFNLVPQELIQQVIKLDYHFISLRYAFSLGPLNSGSAQQNLGSKRKEFGIGFSLKKCQLDFSLQDTKGYYIGNTKDFVPGWQPGDPYIQLAVLKSNITSVKVGYNINSNFSLSSLISGAEQQIKSTYSFIPTLIFNHIRFSDDTTLPRAGAHSDDYYTDFNFRLPIAGTWVLSKQLQVSGVVGPVLGICFFRTDSYNAQLQKIAEKNSLTNTGYYARIGLSFSSDLFYMGADGFIERYGTRQNDENMKRIFYGARIYIGYRFIPPNFLKRTVEKIPL